MITRDKRRIIQNKWDAKNELYNYQRLLLPSWQGKVKHQQYPQHKLIARKHCAETQRKHFRRKTKENKQIFAAGKK